MKDKISRWGIGSFLGPGLIVYGLITIFLTIYFHPFFQIRLIPYLYLLILGIILLLTGIPFWLISGATVMRVYDENRLVTTGVFRFCRHPVYSAMMLFVAPGIAFVSNSWIMLTAPLVGFVLCKIFIKREEDYLEGEFGSVYIEYKKKVPAFIPIGWIVKD